MQNMYIFDSKYGDFIALKSKKLNSNGDYDYYTTMFNGYKCLVFVKAEYAYHELHGKNDDIIPKYIRQDYEPCQITFPHVCHLLNINNCTHLLIMHYNSGVLLVGQEFVSSMWNVEYQYGEDKINGPHRYR